MIITREKAKRRGYSELKRYRVIDKETGVDLIRNETLDAIEESSYLFGGDNSYRIFKLFYKIGYPALWVEVKTP